MILFDILEFKLNAKSFSRKSKIQNENILWPAVTATGTGTAQHEHNPPKIVNLCYLPLSGECPMLFRKIDSNKRQLDVSCGETLFEGLPNGRGTRDTAVACCCDGADAAATELMLRAARVPPGGAAASLLDVLQIHVHTYKCAA